MVQQSLFHHYDLGNGHPLVGRSAPDFGFADGTRLGDLLRKGKASRSTSPTDFAL